MLSIESLSKQYPGGEWALRDVTLDVPPGQVLMVIGPSGAGKSTLIKCMNRLVEPTRGTVRLGDTALTDLRGRSLRHARRRIGMIFQDFGLVDRLSVMENVLCGRLGYVGFWRSLLTRFPKTDVARGLALLDRVGLNDHIDKRADALSGGQRQRVAIARALIQSDEMLLVDEPTASLDPKTSRSIMHLITQLSREHGLTAIINIHDVPLAVQFGDRIVGMHAGSVVFDGPPGEATAEVLTRIYGEEDYLASASGNDEPEDQAPALHDNPVEERLGIPSPRELL